MKLVITDSGLGGLSVCAKLILLLKESSEATSPHLPASRLQITYLNAAPSNERGFNSMSGRDEQLQTFSNILRNTTLLFAPDSIFVACGTLSVLMEHLDFTIQNDINFEGILSIGSAQLLSSLQEIPQSTVIIFGTPTTINEATFQDRLKKNGVAEKRIIVQACPELATQISNDHDGSIVTAKIKHWVTTALQNIPPDSVLPQFAFLACTHYAFRENLFKKAFEQAGLSKISFLNPNQAAAEYLVKLVKRARDFKSSESPDISVEFVTPYEIPEQEINTLTHMLTPEAPETVYALQNANICPELLLK
ncbi:MAG: aspartate/glutamate racemase family protein [SAR324 cluster bacterium]|nr:aspartate/glutamate racemase family protein [SAR324 cluster bacterium]MBL7035333.1 aspartate/glutamate racemase family protein [SAR324 cluster bacterium]